MSVRVVVEIDVDVYPLIQKALDPSSPVLQLVLAKAGAVAPGMKPEVRPGSSEPHVEWDSGADGEAQGDPGPFQPREHRRHEPTPVATLQRDTLRGIGGQGLQEAVE